MPKATPIIRYSLKDRGRQHTGKPRNFNIKALYDSINGPACQETVRSRGMTGYYGHWPRIRFGMNPSEGGLDNAGNPVVVEPAFITTHLKMTMDGIVEHVAEFLDTASGKLAEKLFFDNQAGGFSSAIDEKANQLFGFDYVLQPNFLDNSYRGVSLDDALSGDMGELTYDDVLAAEREEHAQAIISLLDSARQEREASSATIERLQIENEQYLSFLATHKIDPSEVLDGNYEHPLHAVVKLDSTNQLEREIQEFRVADRLPATQPAGDQVKQDPMAQRLINRYTR
ncbi:hypothetical protein SAMN05216302_101120 [Nitrosomonas aestuarii]|uniref:Uncharacterized protein n=1 Tax=Nitrosomonas aestuarii TaxID=52441 RepID=A0A1I4B660_9PROT|nr:hypothetical protein [Nitrosomonas aestuarii]SFK63501.1 hypothetical protein SAMN05216302_101120 [Nitrosomonas aestuarii]